MKRTTNNSINIKLSKLSWSLEKIMSFKERHKNTNDIFVHRILDKILKDSGHDTHKQ